jgi:hypothetical protein
MVSFALVVYAGSIRSAWAAWPRFPHANLPVATAANGQHEPTIDGDGAGGVIVAWQDDRSGTSTDIFAQRILATGVVDPAWPAGGRALCTQAADQIAALVISDGAGGAIVTWQDFRNGTRDIFAQRVLASGVVDPAWPVNGRALCTAPFDQQEANIISDGAGGAIVTWHDFRNGVTSDIFAQHVLASGVVDPAWPANGRALCTAALNQLAPALVSDGAGGAIVAWEDERVAPSAIFAQRVRASGAVDPSWPVDGRRMCATASGQLVAVVASDGAGGAIVAWEDARTMVLDIYAQRVLSSGVVDPNWPLEGRALCTAALDQTEPVIVSDGAGGAIVAWHDARNAGIRDIFAQHVLVSGVVDAAWPIDGRALCSAAGDQINPEIVTDGAGGAIVGWQDTRSGVAADLFAQHVLASGAVDSAWPVNGRALCTAPFDQFDPVMVADGAGGAIAAWEDPRTDIADVYAQRVARFGHLGSPEPEIASVLDVPNDQGGRVRLAWDASYLDTNLVPIVEQYWIFRSAPNAAKVARPGAHRVIRLGETHSVLEPAAVLEMPTSTGTEYWEYLATVDAVHFLGGYSYIAPTTGDSTAASNPLTAFMVVALNASGSQYWPSVPRSGYSVDNLPPGTPSPFTGTFHGTFALLHWHPNLEADLGGYRLHRGTSTGFIPGPGTLVSAQPDTGYTDAVTQPYFYKLSAVDIHGNESPFAYFEMPGASDAPAANVWRSLSLRVEGTVGRNPVFHFVVPRASALTLALYDARGRRVRTVWRGALDTGEHARSWDGRDDRGRPAPSGVYFVRLTDGREALATQIVHLR